MSDKARAGYDLQFGQRFVLSDNQRIDVSGLEDSNRLPFFLSNGIFSRLSVSDLNCNKRDRGFGRIFRSYPHSGVAYTRALCLQTHWKPRPELDIDLNPYPSPGNSEC